MTKKIYMTKTMYIRVSQNATFENDFTFTIFDFVQYAAENLSLKKIADFWKFYYTTFLVNLYHFSYFDPTNKSAIFFFL